MSSLFLLPAEWLMSLPSSKLFTNKTKFYNEYSFALPSLISKKVVTKTESVDHVPRALKFCLRLFLSIWTVPNPIKIFWDNTYTVNTIFLKLLTGKLVPFPVSLSDWLGLYFPAIKRLICLFVFAAELVDIVLRVYSPEGEHAKR